MVNTDLHLLGQCSSAKLVRHFPRVRLVDNPQVAFVHVTINGVEVPLQAARRADDTFLLKFRPMIAGEYSVALKDLLEQPLPGGPFVIPVYNPSVIHLEPFRRLQSIEDCHLICSCFSSPIRQFVSTCSSGNIDKAGPGKFFIMVYSVLDDKQLQPILIPIQIRSLASNRMRLCFTPPQVGTYRIYIAYRNLPINGK